MPESVQVTEESNDLFLGGLASGTSTSLLAHSPPSVSKQPVSVCIGVLYTELFADAITPS